MRTKSWNIKSEVEEGGGRLSRANSLGGRDGQCALPSVLAALPLLPSTRGMQNETEIQFQWLTSFSPICPSAAIRNAAVSGSPRGIHATNVLGIPPRSRVSNTIDSFHKYYGRGLIRSEKETANGRGERCQPALLHVSHNWSGFKGGKNKFSQKRKSPPPKKKTMHEKRTGRQSPMCPRKRYHRAIHEKSNLGGNGNGSGVKRMAM